MNRIEKRFLIPNILTGTNLFLGFLSIITSIHGNYLQAAWYIIFAIFCDTLDGKTARKLNGFSELGKEFDSFCDSISFGVASGVLIYSILSEQHVLQELVLPISFLFILCGVLRLVRFNIITELSKKKGDFLGMPIPVAAGLVASYIIFSDALWGHFAYYIEFLLMAFLATILMVSNVTFLSKPSFLKKAPMQFFLLLTIVTVIFAKYLLFPLFLTYGIYNTFRYIRTRFKHWHQLSA